MMEITAFVIFMAIFALGDIISTLTKGKVPSLFSIAVLSIAGYWSGLIPKDLFAVTGISTALVYLIYYLQLANMGALIPIKEMLRQWKTIAIAAAGLVGIVIGAYVIGGILFGKEAAIIGAPPLAGGIVSYEIMRQGAEAIGKPELGIMALAIFVLQSFLGYPLTAWMLRIESKNLLAEYRKNKTNPNKVETEKEVKVVEVKKKLFPQLPEKYVTTNTVLFKLAVAGLIGIIITKYLNTTFKPEGHGDFISRYVILLIVGVILNEIGFLDPSPIKKAQIGGFTSIVIVGFSVVAGLASATPEVLFQMLVPAIGIIITGCIGMALLSMIAGKFLGYSKEMSFAVALTALYGYPGTEILSLEAVKFATDDPDEKEYITGKILPKMLIGGFTTVTFGSVFLAGILVNFL